MWRLRDGGALPRFFSIQVSRSSIIRLPDSPCNPLSHLSITFPGHDHFRSKRRAFVQVDNILVVHTDTPFRYGLTDKPRRIGPMYPVKRVSEIQCAYAEWVSWVSTGHKSRKFRVFAAHAHGRRPTWINRFSGDLEDTRPSRIPLRDSDGIRNGTPFAENFVNSPIAETDDDCTGFMGHSERNDRPLTRRGYKTVEQPLRRYRR